MSKKYVFSAVGCTIRVGTTSKEMTPEQIKSRYESRFIDTEKQFFDGISKPRNISLMRIFLNMGLTEHT